MITPPTTDIDLLATIAAIGSAFKPDQEPVKESEREGEMPRRKKYDLVAFYTLEGMGLFEDQLEIEGWSELHAKLEAELAIRKFYRGVRELQVVF